MNATTAARCPRRQRRRADRAAAGSAASGDAVAFALAIVRRQPNRFQRRWPTSPAGCCRSSPSSVLA
jgi:hypothetical protein